MTNLPSVYVPTQPESNGLTLPTLLSLLAHGIVLGLLIYTYQQPTIEIPGAVETTMVSPEALAEMQGQILANRAAAQAAGSEASESTLEPINPFDSSNSAQSNESSSSQSVPVFMRSDEPADSGLLMSQEQQQQRNQQMQEYRDNVSEWAAQLDESANDKIEQVQDNKRAEVSEERERLKDYRDKKSNPTTPNVKRPTSSDRNIEIETGSVGRSFNLSDGEASAADSASSSSSSSNNRSSGGSRGTSNSEILNKIKRNYNPPTAAKGATQRATLTITVNASGDIVKVSVSGSDSAVNEAARQAALDTGNLPIDSDDPKYPTFTVQFNGSN